MCVVFMHAPTEMGQLQDKVQSLEKDLEKASKVSEGEERGS